MCFDVHPRCLCKSRIDDVMKLRVKYDLSARHPCNPPA
jgi:hypothetical protein